MTHCIDSISSLYLVHIFFFIFIQTSIFCCYILFQHLRVFQDILKCNQWQGLNKLFCCIYARTKKKRWVHRICNKYTNWGTVRMAYFFSYSNHHWKSVETLSTCSIKMKGYTKIKKNECNIALNTLKLSVNVTRRFFFVKITRHIFFILVYIYFSSGKKFLSLSLHLLC